MIRGNTSEMRQKRKTLWLESFCTIAVWGIMTAILLFLTAMSIFMTCSVYGGNEVIQYKADQPIFHALFLFFVLAGGVWLYRRRTREGTSEGMKQWMEGEAGHLRYRRILLAWAGALGIWFLITCFGPASDQRLALESASALLRHDLTPWAPVGFSYGSPLGVTGYAYTYPSQNGLILFFAIVTFVFRGITPYALQVMNIGFLFIGIICISRMFTELFSLEHMRGISIVMLCFLPFTFYITFIYGTIPGFAFSSLALYFEQRFFKEGRKDGGWGDLFTAAICISLAVLLKSNYLIVLAAMLIYLLTCGIFRKKLQFIAAAVILTALYIGSGKMVNLYLEAVTGQPVSKGSPMLAWVEMGLTEGSRGPGWYNGYNIGVFSDHDLDPEETLIVVKADLKDTLQEFAEAPQMAADFFIRKAASIWAEPSFQGLWIQEIKGNSWLLPGMTKSLFKEGGLLNRLFMFLFNYIQSLVYIGALLFFILYRKRITWEQLIFAVVFIGGFLFHMAWEAKGQYSVCYFILLIPYAALGLKEAICLIGRAKE